MLPNLTKFCLHLDNQLSMVSLSPVSYTEILRGLFRNAANNQPPKAIYRDEKKLQSFRSSQASKSSIDVYSCAGKLIRRINWDKGSIEGLGWSEDEKLLVVT